MCVRVCVCVWVCLHVLSTTSLSKSTSSSTLTSSSHMASKDFKSIGPGACSTSVHLPCSLDTPAGDRKQRAQKISQNANIGV